MCRTPSSHAGFRSGIDLFDRVYELATETVRLNIKPWKDGLLEAEAPAIMAGQAYDKPWTRDAAYNTWNAGALLFPHTAKNTLISTLRDEGGKPLVGGQYWDAIAWTTGAWAYYCVTGEEDFLRLAYEATANSLRYLEENELDEAVGLFNGPASYGDGVAAYPHPFNQTGGSSFILDYVTANPRIDKIRMKALSTNCLYYNAYRIAAAVAQRLGASASDWGSFQRKGEALKTTINDHLWMQDEGYYAYFMYPEGHLDTHMEGLGHSLAILTGVANAEQAVSIFRNQYVSQHGIPCLWPVFARFRSEDGMSFGRHNGTVWPHIQGFWATAAAMHRNVGAFEHELDALARLADRHNEFKEIYHPVTGEPYGGLQIDGGKMRLWDSCPRQTWSATAYLRMIHMGLFGMTFEPEGIHFEPLVPERFERIALTELAYRDMTLDVTVNGSGDRIKQFRLDGEPNDSQRVPASLRGRHVVAIDVQ